MNPKDFIIRHQNRKLLGNGLTLLNSTPREFASCAFLDPQYREILEKMRYGNEGARQKERAVLPQMSSLTICDFLLRITSAIVPGGYIFFWVDKFILCEGIHLGYIHEVNKINASFKRPLIHLVDMITWDKGRIGQGYRSRRQSEHLLVIQKSPKGIKSWKDKGIPDVWQEKIENPKSNHAHKKPIGLIHRLIESVTEPVDFVIDPCAGSFVTLDASEKAGRRFIGCDISPKYGKVRF